MKKTILIILALSYAIIINYSCNKEEDEKDEPITTFTDTRDGKIYNIVTIGTQTWMAENLNYAVLGSCYNSEASCDVYGKLYRWSSLESVIPSGWHLPSDAEWDVLINYLGGDSLAGDKLKETGETHWKSDWMDAATNSSGFTALPGGCLTCGSASININSTGYWWSSTVDTSYTNNAWTRKMVHSDGFVQRYSGSKKYAYSVRCIKD